MNYRFRLITDLLYELEQIVLLYERTELDYFK